MTEKPRHSYGEYNGVISEELGIYYFRDHYKRQYQGWSRISYSVVFQGRKLDISDSHIYVQDYDIPRVHLLMERWSYNTWEFKTTTINDTLIC